MTALSYIPSYRDVNVSFTGADCSGQATVHYVEAGDPHLPTLVLFHGFPSSSLQFRDLIPLLSDSYHVLAPDFPAFGFTVVPPGFKYTFDSLAAVTAAWLDAIHVKTFAMYIHDYGAPVGLRIALQWPTQISAIVTQNGNAYVEGFGQDFWAPLFSFWKATDLEPWRKVLRENVLVPDGIKYQYVEGTPEKDMALLNPQSWTFAYLQNIAGETNIEHQLSLFYDYRKNVEMYSRFQEYFRTSKVPILAVWAKNDPAFIPPGALAFKNDQPDTVIHLLEAGHFALETVRWEIARIMKQWLASIGY